MLGVLGGGQLGRMLAQAASRLGVKVRCYDETPDACAAGVAELHVGGFTDFERLDRFAAGLAAVTYEFENVPVAAAEHLGRRQPCFPPPGALRVCQDRLEEKTLFRRLGVGTAGFAAVASGVDLTAAIEAIGVPGVLKTRRGGYDGKGQAVVRSVADAEHGFVTLGGGRSPLIYEAFVPFEREVSILACRGRDGAVVFYPLSENEHAGGILRVARALWPEDSAGRKRQAQAEEVARAVMEAMGYVGLLAIEFFELRGELLANEMAPRVHNSGHWTMDACPAGQFENHVRSVLGWPMGETTPMGPAAMVNLIGDHPPIERLLELPGARVHLYDKAPRAGRKIGHVNLIAGTPTELARRVEAARRVIEPTAR